MLAGAVVNANVSLHQGVLVNSGAVLDHDAICGASSQLAANAAMAGGSRLGSLACLASGEELACRQTRFAALQLAPDASYPREGLTLKPGKLPCPEPLCSLPLGCGCPGLGLSHLLIRFSRRVPLAICWRCLMVA